MTRPSPTIDLSLQNVFDASQPVDGATLSSEDRARLSRRLLLYAFVGSAVYGLSMGLKHSLLQGLVAAAKVPVLFTLTLLVCLPSLYFLGLRSGCRVSLATLGRTLLRGISVSSLMLSGFAPISLFFVLSGSRYSFMLGLHVLVFAFCGLAGLVSTVRGFQTLRTSHDAIPEGAPAARILAVWLLIYMFVGTQLAYMLSPFVGKDEVFMLFTSTEYNFYTYLWDMLPL